MERGRRLFEALCMYYFAEEKYASRLSYFGRTCKDLLILRIVYDKNLSLSYFFGCTFCSKIISQVCYIKVLLFYETLQPKYGNLFGRFLFKIVDTRSFIRRFPHSAFWQLASSLWMTTCIKSAVHNLHQVCSSQLASSLQFTTCTKPAIHNLQQACSSQLASSLQFTTCIKPAIHNLQQACSSQLASSLQFTTCSKSVDNLQQTWYYQAGASDANASWYRLDDRKWHQVCSRPAATCAFLAVYSCIHCGRHVFREKCICCATKPLRRNSDADQQPEPQPRPSSFIYIF